MLKHAANREQTLDLIQATGPTVKMHTVIHGYPCIRQQVFLKRVPSSMAQAQVLCSATEHYQISGLLKNSKLEIYSQDSDPRIHYDFLYAESLQSTAVLKSI